MARKAVSTIAIVVFLAFTSLAVGAQFGSSTLRGHMEASSVTITAVTSTGQAAANVRVDVTSPGMRSLLVSGYTNSAGIVEFRDLPNGTFEATAYKGVLSASERLEVNGGSGSATLRLPVDGDPEAGNGAMVSVAQYKVSGKARKELKKAQKALDKREMEKAKQHVEKALAIYPDYAEALTMRGLLKLDAQENDAAINDFDAAIKIDPGYYLAYLALGAAQNRKQEYDPALRSLDRGLALSPKSWQGYFEVAKAHVGKGDYAAAVKNLDKAQSLLEDTKYPPIHLVKGHALLALRQYDNAMMELQVFLDAAPEAPQTQAAREMLEQAKAFAGRR